MQSQTAEVRLTKGVRYCCNAVVYPSPAYSFQNFSTRVCCLLFAVCCLLFAVCCLLFAVCCLSAVFRSSLTFSPLRCRLKLKSAEYSERTRIRRSFLLLEKLFVLHQTSAMASNSDNVLFVGNPGTGKVGTCADHSTFLCTRWLVR